MEKVKAPVLWLMAEAGTTWLTPQPVIAMPLTFVGFVTVPVTVDPAAPVFGVKVTAPVPAPAELK
jgi:hypothetical protein